MLTIYTYAQCDSCRRATKLLREQGVEFEERPIRETPPSRVELRTMLAAQGGELRKLSTLRGRDYREQKIGGKIAELSEAAAFELLRANGNLVKRPFLIGDGVAMVGFDASSWIQALPRKR